MFFSRSKKIDEIYSQMTALAEMIHNNNREIFVLKSAVGIMSEIIFQDLGEGSKKSIQEKINKYWDPASLYDDTGTISKTELEIDCMEMRSKVRALLINT